ncbi:hypothetical protein PIB30_033965 [Stylosanthes scabra]|uniref:Uncharacterized protein n=1 Tax=Stylosanthes scabra TaxID=79078 RepID=A0ABU6RCT9_9FABA|nr:hypothetical protein [Stylosanthes scabra]
MQSKPWEEEGVCCVSAAAIAAGANGIRIYCVSVTADLVSNENVTCAQFLNSRVDSPPSLIDSKFDREQEMDFYTTRIDSGFARVDFFVLKTSLYDSQMGFESIRRPPELILNPPGAKALC